MMYTETYTREVLIRKRKKINKRKESILYRLLDELGIVSDKLISH